MLARAEAAARARGLDDVELYRMDGADLGFAPRSFERVLCSFGLRAFPDQTKALIGFHRVLRPGGLAAVAYPRGWPFQTDRRWAWQGEALASFGVRLTNDELADGDLTELLRDAGFQDVETLAAICPLEFQDAFEWWAWSWSHGTRSLFEAVPDGQRPALQQELFTKIETCRGLDGKIHGSMQATLIRGRKP
jgi:SAM-dependent methyltransferase